MRISFDLDDTLICLDPNVPRERTPWLARFISNEPLRAGAVDLMSRLRRYGWLIDVYTSSLRPAWRVRLWLRAYGIRVERVVNSNAHNRTDGVPEGPSKHPGQWQIDLHVDDSEGVALEGRRFGFNVVCVRPDDLDWTTRVLEAANALQAASQVFGG